MQTDSSIKPKKCSVCKRQLPDICEGCNRPPQEKGQRFIISKVSELTKAYNQLAEAVVLITNQNALIIELLKKLDEKEEVKD